MIARIVFIYLLIFISGISYSYAEVSLPADDTVNLRDEKVHEILEHTEDAEFNAGVMILEHVIDAHEWHILTYTDSKGEKHHVSIPLPVILYHNGKFVTFWSSELAHGHTSDKGFKIETDGENKGKIIKTLEHEILEGERLITEGDDSVPIDLSITKNVLALFIRLILLSWIFIYVANSY